jgi:hypothetical protein
MNGEMARSCGMLQKCHSAGFVYIASISSFYMYNTSDTSNNTSSRAQIAGSRSHFRRRS